MSRLASASRWLLCVCCEKHFSDGGECKGCGCDQQSGTHIRAVNRMLLPSIAETRAISLKCSGQSQMSERGFCVSYRGGSLHASCIAPCDTARNPAVVADCRN
jgi:hypothetical protein